MEKIIQNPGPHILKTSPGLEEIRKRPADSKTPTEKPKRPVFHGSPRPNLRLNKLEASKVDWFMKGFEEGVNKVGNIIHKIDDSLWWLGAFDSFGPPYK